jgi:tRNA A37 threonylcarbamoyladenosine synthetase subunit TsaC/SUA5/YrdC
MQEVDSGEDSVMTPRQRVIAISVPAGAAALALAVWLIVALTGSSAPAPPSASPRSSALLSPFTGQPVAALGPVLAVKIDNIKQARRSVAVAAVRF